ncbi:MAG: hypothetical protein QOC92_3997, partial [Acidimicrobiaceae bacterium]
ADGIRSIKANSDTPGNGVTWYPDKGVSCYGPQDSVPCN